MRNTFFTIFLALFLVSNNVVAQNTENQITLDEESYFKLNNEEVNSFNNQAITAYENEKFQQAGFLYIKAFKYSAGTNYDILHNSLIAFISAQDFYNADVCYTKLLEEGIDTLKKETQVSFHKNMALLYDSQKNSGKFINAINLAIALQKNNIELLLIKGNYYYKTGDTDNFILQLEKAHQIDPKHFNTNYNLGTIYSQKGNFNKAKYHYKKALKANKKSEAANLNFASLLLSQDNEIITKMYNHLGDFKKYDSLNLEKERIHKSAIPYLKKVLKINKNNTDVIRTLTAVYESLGYDKKVEKLRKQTSD